MDAKYKFLGGDFRQADIGDKYYSSLTPEQRSNEVEKQLAALTEAIEQATKDLPAAKAQEVRNDLETLKKEVKTEAPRRKMFEVTGEGLIEATKTVATMAPSITAAVMEIGKLLFA